MKHRICSVKGCKQRAFYCHINGFIFAVNKLKKEEVMITFACLDHDEIYHDSSLPLKNKRGKILRDIQLINE